VGCRKHVPVWHEKTKKLVEAGKLVVIGITQEQHAERCLLFKQWKKLGWPILHDPLNLAGLRVVPRFVAIDEHFVTRDLKPNPDTLEADFVDKTFPTLGMKFAFKPQPVRDPAQAEKTAQTSNTASDWRACGDSRFVAGDIDGAIDAYGRAIRLDSTDAAAHFRLGVCHRTRYDSDARQADDFQTAIDYWRQALELDPNHYIYRRRIQQYGPRLDKPYAFYDWIETARREVKSRGETPVTLAAEPVGAELADAARAFESSTDQAPQGDPDGRVTRDEGLVSVDTAVIEATDDRQRGVVRVHVTFRPTSDGYWNNEAEPLRVWFATPDGASLSHEYVAYADPRNKAESREPRSVGVELRFREGRPCGRLKGYALFNVCKGKSAECLHRRQDFEVSFDAAPAASQPVPQTMP
jgi:tetratricopeptide (TPR) repeat protein